jgi:hypothetical protein
MINLPSSGAIYPIDPITGLPNTTLPDFSTIDQIPLGSQVFPWQDLKPNQKPSRGPAYPDDILPTTALVGGQNRDNPQQHQTAYTDGKHALLVNNIGGGGGGGGVSPVKYQAGFTGQGFGPWSSGANGQVVASVTYTTAIYGLIATLVLYGTTGSPTGKSHGDIWVADTATHAQGLYLATFPFNLASGDVEDVQPPQVQIMLPLPIDVNLTFGTGLLDVILDANAGKWHGMIQLLGN